MSEHNTLFLRLEAPLQSWGLQGKLVFRDSAREPTKSGVVGLLACALGRKRWESVSDLAELEMGVRVDREGALTRDYHTVGAKIGIIQADASKGIKHTASTGEIETLISVRMYLSDASFLVALRGDPDTIRNCADAAQDPEWPIYLGRKSCPPSVPPYVGTAHFDDLKSAIASIPWRPAFVGDTRECPTRLRLQLEVPPDNDKGMTRGDHPIYFWPPEAEHSQFQQIPRHSARYVVEDWLSNGEFEVSNDFSAIGDAFVPKAERRDDPGYNRVKGSKLWNEFLRPHRLQVDNYICALTGLPAEEVHHKKYRDDIPSLTTKEEWESEKWKSTLRDHIDKDLVSLSRIAHEAVSLLEYRYDLGAERIDPLDSRWRPKVLITLQGILEKRETAFRRRKQRSL
ncbi:MAG: type I-E CRISPR-associated protein Cas5/CasD [Planctomycetes bacterium]|nr:type I-E CRISPR-associated protein Cas5/CasD [Planctomycetota bacterium]